MRAKYLLTNVKIENDYKHGYYFQTDEQRRSTIIGTSSFSSEEINFDKGRMLAANCVVNTYNNENYMVIDYDGELLYYFVNNATYLSVNQWQLNLELDVITQYLTGMTKADASVCLINRAHCNRFVKSGDKVKFDVSSKSPIIKSEENFKLFPKDRKKVKIKYSNSDAINKWLQDNIICWCYLFVDANYKYKWESVMYDSFNQGYVYHEEKVSKSRFYVDGSRLEEEYGVLAFPIYKSNKKIYFYYREPEGSNPRNAFVGYIENDNNFMNYRDGENIPHVYNIKYSFIPPIDFSLSFFNSHVSFVDGDMRITHEITQSPGEVRYYQGWKLDGHFDIRGVNPNSNDGPQDLEYKIIDNVQTIVMHGNLITCVDHHKIELEELELPYTFEFTKEEIKDNAQHKFEPKLLLDTIKCVLRDCTNGEFVYNPLWLNSNVLKPLYDEMLNITNTNMYYRLKASGLYVDQTDKNWEGVCNTYDISRQIVNDAYAEFIANNKNFLLGRFIELAPSALFSLLQGNLKGFMTPALQGLATPLEIENIMNRPNSLRNASLTSELILKVNSGINLYVDIEEAREFDVARYYRFLYRYGYKLDIIANPFDYLNTRKYFNYIQCELEHINIPNNEAVVEKIKNIFRNGITLWNNHYRIYTYGRENYELWLDNEEEVTDDENH